MSKVSVTKRKLDALAAAISLKSGEDLPLTLDAMREAVNNITFPEPGDSFDGPVFTADSELNITCDKTYSEIMGLISNGMYNAKLIMPSSNPDEPHLFYGSYAEADDDTTYLFFPTLPQYEDVDLAKTTMLCIFVERSGFNSEVFSSQAISLPTYSIFVTYDGSSVAVDSINTEYTYDDANMASVINTHVNLNNGRSIRVYECAGTRIDNNSVVQFVGYVLDNIKITITHNSDESYSATAEFVVPPVKNQYGVTVTPTRYSQTIAPDDGYTGLGTVTVNAIPSNYGDTTGDTARSEHLLNNMKAHTIISGVATQITGTMPNRGAITATIDGITTTSYAIPEGYHSGSGTVSLTNAIELALAAI